MTTQNSQYDLRLLCLQLLFYRVDCANGIRSSGNLEEVSNYGPYREEAAVLRQYHDEDLKRLAANPVADRLIDAVSDGKCRRQVRGEHGDLVSGRAIPPPIRS
jgi:hypothetical protein